MPAPAYQIGHRVTVDMQGTVFGGAGTRDGVVIWVDPDLVGVDCGLNTDPFWTNSQGREGYGVHRKWIIRTRRPTKASQAQAESVRAMREL